MSPFEEKDTNMFHIPMYDNKVRVAVDRAGGPTRVATMLGVANNTVHSWIHNKNVPNINHARRLADATFFDVRELRPVR